MMNTTTTSGAVVCMVLLAALLIQPTPPAHAEESQVQGTMILATLETLGVPIGEFSVLVPGAAADTLTACRTRIPELASMGQQLLAEQSCAGEEETRKTIRSTPPF